MTIASEVERIILNATMDLEDGILKESPRYTTVGSVRGGCGHRHTSIETAAKCLAADQRGCECHGGYSDRKIVEAL